MKAEKQGAGLSHQPNITMHVRIILFLKVLSTQFYQYELSIRQLSTVLQTNEDKRTQPSPTLERNQLMN